MSGIPIRSMRPHVHVLDRNSEKYRGGMVWQINGGTSVIRLQAEASYVRDKTVSTSLIPVDARSVGCPVVCKVTGNDADSYQVTEVLGGTFNPRDGAPRPGVFAPSIIARNITNESETYWEAWTD
jgi:hypothetical protein